MYIQWTFCSSSSWRSVIVKGHVLYIHVLKRTCTYLFLLSQLAINLPLSAFSPLCLPPFLTPSAPLIHSFPPITDYSLPPSYTGWYSYTTCIENKYMLLYRMAVQHSTWPLWMAMWQWFSCCSRDMLMSAFVLLRYVLSFWGCGMWMYSPAIL